MEFLFYMGLIHLILALIASLVIYRSKIYDRPQKVRQFLFAVFLPLMGPAVTLAIFWGDRHRPATPSDRMMGESINEHYRKHHGRLFSLFLLLLLTVGSLLMPQALFASVMTVLGPCNSKPLMHVTFPGPEKGQIVSLGSATVSVLNSHKVPFQGDASGIKSIFNSPVGDEALEVISNTEMRAYGWCVTVNGQQPAVMPDEVLLKGSNDNVIWFYAFTRYDRGEWKEFCTPSYKVRTLPVCQTKRSSR